MTFQGSEYREWNFLELNNNDNQPIHLTYSKNGVWLKHFDLLISICVWLQIIYLLVNIGLGFFPKNPLLVCVEITLLK